MYQLFKSDIFNRNTKNDAPDFLFARRMLLKEMTRIRNYYRESNRVVKGDHILNQLLLNLNVSLQRDLESYVRTCSIETERLARAFRLIHPVVDDPLCLQGEFYNGGCNEFVILHSNEFDYLKAYSNWKNLTPIRVHNHPFSDLTCGIADGNYVNSLSETGTVIISINLPLLALQYRAWQEKVNQHLEYQNPVVNFIHQFPITNMIYQHMEITLFNRMVKIYNQTPTPQYKSIHPLAVSNLDEQVDKVLSSRINLLKTGNYKFDQFFSIFDCLTRQTFFEVIRPLDIAPVRSVKWVLEMQTLSYFEFFLQVRQDTQGKYNGYEISRSLRDIRLLENDATYFKANFQELNNRLKRLRTLVAVS